MEKINWKGIKYMLTWWMPVSNKKVALLMAETLKVIHAQCEFSMTTRRDVITLAAAISRLHGLKTVNEAFIKNEQNKQTIKKDEMFG